MTSVATAVPHAADSTTPGPFYRDRSTWLVLGALTAFYVFLISFACRRFVWFDELFTFDIARAHTVGQLWDWVLRYDNNPPSVYLLSRWSMSVFGPTPIGLRLPNIVEFYLGSVALLLYLRRKIGLVFASVGVLTLWAGETWYYAAEARPYALILMGFCWLLLSWDTAVSSKPRQLALVGVAISGFLMLAAHVFASLSLLPFMVAEFWRWRRRGRPDWPLWLAMLLPTVAVSLYIPLLRVYHGMIFAPDAQGSWIHSFTLFQGVVHTVEHPLFLGIVAVFLLAPLLPRAAERPTHLGGETTALFVTLMLLPFLLNLIVMLIHGGYHDRYSLTTQVGVYALLAILLRRYLPGGRYAGLVCCLVLLGFCAKEALRPANGTRPNRDGSVASILDSYQPDLPLAVASGVTFFEMNHHETPQMLARTYFLKDRAAAMRTDKTNYFYEFVSPDDMQREGFPIRGETERYQNFVRQHRRFLLWSSPRTWVIENLQRDGASVVMHADYEGAVPYGDTQLYLVTMPSGQ